MRTKPTRLFRSDTPHDVVCASLVASTLPDGRNVLAITADKCPSDRATYLSTLYHMSTLYPWDAICDISGAALNHPKNGQTFLRSTVETIHHIRNQLAPVLGIHPASSQLPNQLDGQVDEVYLTCLYHPDIWVWYTIFPSANKNYSPHGFDSLHSCEIDYYRSGGEPAPRTWKQFLGDLWKYHFWGIEAVPVRHTNIDIAYSFNHPMPWASRTVFLHELLRSDHLMKLYRKLPIVIQDYYDTLAELVPKPALLLLLSAQTHASLHPHELELASYAELASRMMNKEGITSFLVKPHPQSTMEWNHRCISQLTNRLPNATFILVDKFHNCPIELLCVPLTIAAAGSLFSGSLRTLNRLFGIRSYLPYELALNLFSYDPKRYSIMKVFLEDLRSHVVPI